MKRILIATATFALFGAPAAFAQQDQGGHHRDQGQGGQAHSQGQQASQPQGRVTQSQGQQPAGRPDWNAYYRNNPDLQRNYQSNQRNPAYTESQQAYAERHYREHGQAEGRALPTSPGAQVQSQTQWQGNQRGGQWQGNQRGGQWQGDQRGGQWQGNQRGGQWQGDQRGGQWRGGDRRSEDRANHGDWGRYQRNEFAQHRFRFGGYERPRGWYYRRWRFGEFLPGLFWSQNYWIGDYNDFGLPYPPPGCVWVRYGDDALLIDRYTGEIVQVMYGLFY